MPSYYDVWKMAQGHAGKAKPTLDVAVRQFPELFGQNASVHGLLPTMPAPFMPIFGEERKHFLGIPYTSQKPRGAVAIEERDGNLTLLLCSGEKEMIVVAEVPLPGVGRSMDAMDFQQRLLDGIQQYRTRPELPRRHFYRGEKFSSFLILK